MSHSVLMQKRKDLIFGVILAFVLGMKKLGLSDIIDYREDYEVLPLVSRIKLKYYGNDERGKLYPRKTEENSSG